MVRAQQSALQPCCWAHRIQVGRVPSWRRARLKTSACSSALVPSFQATMIAAASSALSPLQRPWAQRVRFARFLLPVPGASKNGFAAAFTSNLGVCIKNAQWQRLRSQSPSGASQSSSTRSADVLPHSFRSQCRGAVSQQRLRRRWQAGQQWQRWLRRCHPRCPASRRCSPPRRLAPPLAAATARTPGRTPAGPARSGLCECTSHALELLAPARHARAEQELQPRR